MRRPGLQLFHHKAIVCPALARSVTLTVPASECRNHNLKRWCLHGQVACLRSVSGLYSYSTKEVRRFRRKSTSPVLYAGPRIRQITLEQGKGPPSRYNKIEQYHMYYRTSCETQSRTRVNQISASISDIVIDVKYAHNTRGQLAGLKLSKRGSVNLTAFWA